MRYPKKYQAILKLSALADKTLMNRIYQWSADDLNKLWIYIKRQNRKKGAK